MVLPGLRPTGRLRPIKGFHVRLNGVTWDGFPNHINGGPNNGATRWFRWCAEGGVSFV